MLLSGKLSEQMVAIPGLKIGNKQLRLSVLLTDLLN